MASRVSVRSVTFVLAAVLTVAACTASSAPSTVPSSAPSPASSAGVSPDATDLPPEPSTRPLTGDPLHSVELFDVSSQTTFTLGALAAERPVLLEMMAIWCPTCRTQQIEIAAAHEQVAFHSVSLDIDPNERPGDLAAYSEANGFDWRFAMANHTLAAALRDRFGPAVLNPPSTPVILLFPDGSVRALEFRVHSAAELAAEIAAG